jgi:hypothetical protein
MPGRCRRFPVVAVSETRLQAEFSARRPVEPGQRAWREKARAAPSIFNRWARVDSSGVGCRQRDFFSYSGF